MKKWLTLLFLFFWFGGFSQSTRSLRAVRTNESPVIDGFPKEECWLQSAVANDFIQKSPFYNVVPTQKTEVRVLYNDNGIFFGIECFDSAPDSILRQLGSRDEELNSDKFSIMIDPYNNHLDAFVFEVHASGPQIDWRMQDESFSSVWQSESKISEQGWSAEIFIPYSALRFPRTDVQTWGIQFQRTIRRNREISQWALEERNASNIQMSWGTLKGIQGIDPPVRLSLNPYLTASMSHFPHHNAGISDFSKSIGGGLDLKAGLSESYTIDMTLLPDFSQVQSDDIIKNLSSFETQYEEQRLFFKEAVDLFQKGGLFYSRRIGRTPRNFYSIYSQLDSGEVILSNPAQAQLINASKFSGRSKNGLAVGFFNAITNDTYAEIRQADGEIRKVLTDPFTNYNILVIDKEFKNSSSFYIINTNAKRKRQYESSNVSGFGGSLYSKSKTLKAGGSVAYSMSDTALFSSSCIDRAGLATSVSFSKVRGKFRWSMSQSTRNTRFDINDMGISHMNNYLAYAFSSTYSFYNPTKWIKELHVSPGMEYSFRLSNGHPIGNEISATFRLLTMRHFYLWGGFIHSLTRVSNYYEPRVEGYVYREPLWGYAYVGFSSTYSKPFALDGDLSITRVPSQSNSVYTVSLSPLLKIGNHFQFRYQCGTAFHNNEVGFAGIDSLGVPLLGSRDVTTIENTFSATYVIRNYMPVSIRVRHYYTQGSYSQFNYLLPGGDLDSPVLLPYNFDFTFNTFNIDFVYSWQFSPGSSLSLIWKTGILSDMPGTHLSYLQNLKETLDTDQLNSLTLKVIYYIDYEQIAKRKKRN
ncbi:MAG: hypothetical protein CVU11_06970 [Bacteroidetes bacterium HGW-Bacteroidetes-6]|nr:MAG: hypothetical protein CVU11_06970 [Bacteroidetes bacterium HGW-Bacteroidetes-6]